MHNLSFSLGTNVKVAGANKRINLGHLHGLVTQPSQDYASVIEKVARINRLTEEAFNKLGLIDGSPEYQKYKKEHLSPVKNTLYFFIPGGWCPTHHHNHTLEFNGVVQCDFDFKEKDGDAKALRFIELIKSDPYVLFAALSVTKFGVKVLVYTDCKDKDQYKDCETKLRAYFQEKYGETIDTLGASFPCFLMYDPKAYLNLESQIFHFEPSQKSAERKEFKARKGDEELLNALRSVTDQNADYDVWILFGYAVYNLFGEEDGFDIFDFVSDKSAKYSVKDTGKVWKYICRSAKTNQNREKQAGYTTIVNFLKDECGITIESKKSKPKETQKEEDSPFDHAIEYLNSFELRRNEVTWYIESKGKPQSEQDINSIIIDTKRNVKISKDDVKLILNSNEITSYHPIREFFLSRAAIKSQGEIDKLISCIQPETTNYNQIFLKRWLVGLVASVFEQTANVLMLVLVGPPNSGKTWFFEHLLPSELQRYYARNKLDQGKDSEALMCNKLLILNDELDNLTRYEAKSFRNFISGSSYTFRPPYALQDVTRKRLASLCGTSNDKDVISDHENNRRIIPINVWKIDQQLYNSIEKELLILEAYHLYKSGYGWDLTKNEIDLLKKSTLEYRTVSLERELVQRFYRVPVEGESCKTLRFDEIFTRLERETKTRITIKTVGVALKECGFTQGTRKIPNSRSSERVYRVIELSEGHIAVPHFNYQ